LNMGDRRGVLATVASGGVAGWYFGSGLLAASIGGAGAGLVTNGIQGYVDGGWQGAVTQGTIGAVAGAAGGLAGGVAGIAAGAFSEGLGLTCQYGMGRLGGLVEGAAEGAAFGFTEGVVRGGANGYLEGGWAGAAQGAMDQGMMGAGVGGLVGGALGAALADACFRAGTQVVVGEIRDARDGFNADQESGGVATLRAVKLLTRNVEHMRRGNTLSSLNENDPTGDLITSYVEEVHVRTVYHLQIVTLLSSNGIVQRIDTTGEHPAQLLGKGWVASREFIPGDLIQERCGGYSIVLSSIREEHPEGITVYNFRVAGSHTYFVRAEGSQAEPVWVHNACEQLKFPFAEEAAPSGTHVTKTLAQWLVNSKALLEETRDWFKNRPDWWSINPDETPVFYRPKAEADAIRAQLGESGGHHPHGLALGGPEGQTLTWTGESVDPRVVNETHSQVTGLQMRVINAIRRQL
jgi:hypothetical protein